MRFCRLWHPSRPSVSQPLCLSSFFLYSLNHFTHPYLNRFFWSRGSFGVGNPPRSLALHIFMISNTRSQVESGVYDIFVCPDSDTVSGSTQITLPWSITGSLPCVCRTGRRSSLNTGTDRHEVPAITMWLSFIRCPTSLKNWMQVFRDINYPATNNWKWNKSLLGIILKVVYGVKRNTYCEL